MSSDDDYSDSSQTSYSFPKDYGYRDDININIIPDLEKPNIWLTGLKKSGKSSIRKVVFHKMRPHDTLFLHSTIDLEREIIDNSNFAQFTIWEIPVGMEYAFTPLFYGRGAFVFIIDAQDQPDEALSYLNNIVRQSARCSMLMSFEIFIHKVDNLSEEYKADFQKKVSQTAIFDLHATGDYYIHYTFHQTSIYNYSLWEALSRVIQKSIIHADVLQGLLNMMCISTGVDKSFFFDIKTKLFVAVDSRPFDSKMYGLTCETIELIMSITSIYGTYKTETDLRKEWCTKEYKALFDHHSYGILKLKDGTIFFLREVNKDLALVCILNEDNYGNEGIIQVNSLCIRTAICQMMQLWAKHQPKLLSSTATFPDIIPPILGIIPAKLD